MKSWLMIVRHLLLVACACCAEALPAQTYFFDGDEVVFEFDSRLYAKAAAEGKVADLDFADLKIHEVIVSGNFEHWSADDWRMKKTGRYKYQLRKQLEQFDDPFTWEFKFLVNGKYWIEPASGLGKEKVFSNDFWEETFDLTFNQIDPVENGNTIFRLDGYTWATEVILAGSFNNWNEHYLKMNKATDGWEVQIDLPPGRYEYKFIVDGKWMHDPDNPQQVRNEHATLNSVLEVKKAVPFQLRGFDGAGQVVLAGSFNKWNEEELKMTRQDGLWTITLQLTGGKHLYKFIVDGEWMTDPANPLQEMDRFGHINSVLLVR